MTHQEFLFFAPNQILIPKKQEEDWNKEIKILFQNFLILEKSLDYLYYYRVSFLQIISFVIQDILFQKDIFSVIEEIEKKTKHYFPDVIKQEVKNYFQQAIEISKEKKKFPLLKSKEKKDFLNLSDVVLNSIQQKAFEKVIYNNEISSGLVILSSGVGKTILGLKIALEFYSEKILILVPNDILQNRWEKELINVFQVPQEKISKKILKKNSRKFSEKKFTENSKNFIKKKIFILSYKQFISSSQENLILETPQIILIDEVHNIGEKELEILQKINSVKIGLSATCIFPNFETEKKISQAIGCILYQNQEKVVSNKIHYKILKINFEKEEQINYLLAEKKNQKYKIAAINKEKLKQLKEILIQHKNKKIIVFCHFKEQLKTLKEKFKLTCISNTTSYNKKIKTYEDFNEEKINIFATTAISNEGVDLPKANVVIQLSGNRDNPVEEKQRLGRIFRKKKEELYFYSLVTKDTIEESSAVKRSTYIEK